MRMFLRIAVCLGVLAVAGSGVGVMQLWTDTRSLRLRVGGVDDDAYSLRLRAGGVDDDAYAVYAAVLEHRYGDGFPQRLIVDWTVPNTYLPAFAPGCYLAHFDAFSDLTARNTLAHRLQTWRIGGDWTYEPTPMVGFHIRLSAVGFDASRRHAVVYHEHFAYSCTDQSADGELYFLEKRGERWAVIAPETSECRWHLGEL